MSQLETVGQKLHAFAVRLFGVAAGGDDVINRRVLDLFLNRKIGTQRGSEETGMLTFGQRAADDVAKFGGSWTFIMLFAVFLLCWSILNTEILGRTAFDPYPYVFLNLILSMLAAIQAPIIMMSQNRLAQRDREMADHDYQTNLKAEIEIMALHEKFDAMRIDELRELIERQQLLLETITKQP